MKVGIYRLDELLGTLEYDLEAPNPELKITAEAQSDEDFRAYVRQLKKRMDDREFITNLPARLRSLIYAQVIDD